MRKKVLSVCWSLFLIVSVFGQIPDRFTGQGFGTRGMIDDEGPMVYPLVTSRDKPGILVLNCYAMDANEISHTFIKLSDFETIYWTVDYTAVFNTSVVFHFIWSGPEYVEFETDSYPAKYKSFDFVWVSSSNRWEKGTYTFTVIAEDLTSKGGAETVATSRVRFY